MPRLASREDRVMVHYASYAVPLIIVAAIMGALVVYAWPYRNAPGVRACIAMNAGVAIWALAYALEIVSSNYAAKVFWAQVQYIGIVIVPTSWLVFSLDYTGSSRFGRSTVFWLMVFPVAMLGIVWTNSFHHLLWARMTIPPPSALPALSLVYGPAFWIHLGYSYLLLFLGLIVMMRTLIRSTERRRYQAATLLIGALAPWAGNVIYVARINPFGALDLTPFAFAITSLAMAWSIFRYHLFEMTPIAYQKVIDSMDDAAVIFDREKHIIALNPVSQRFFTQSKDPVTGQTTIDIPPWWNAVWSQIGQTEVIRDSFYFDSDQQRCFFDLRLSPLFSHKNRLQGYVAIFHEVTEVKRAEIELRRLYDSQFVLIEQLNVAKQAAEDANSAKTQFVSFASHELKTPMTAILGYTDILKLGIGGPISQDQEEFLNNIRTNVTTMSLLVSDLNDITYMESGRFSLESGEVVLESVIAQVIHANSALIRTNNIQLNIDMKPNLPYIKGDYVRILQVLTNLVSNACKYSLHGGSVTVRAKTVTPTSGTAQMLISVQDTGIGIDPEQQQHLFTKFFRSTEAKRHGIAGTGLGLHIAKQLVDLHGGSIWFESALGVGTTFYVTLPLATNQVGESFVSTPVSRLAQRLW